MRKLLSLLAISSFVSIITTNVISCRRSPFVLVDLNNFDFSKITLDEAGKQDALELLYQIRTQIANYAQDDVVASEIAGNEINFFIAVWLLNNDIEQQITSKTTGGVLSGAYDVKLWVKYGNPWFRQTNGYIIKKVAVIVAKQDLHDLPLHSLSAANGTELYTLLREILSSYSNNPDLSSDDIKNSNDLTIAVYDPTGQGISDDHTSLRTDSGYKLVISANANQTWFKPVNLVTLTFKLVTPN